jgi:hypothetical protein
MMRHPGPVSPFRGTSAANRLFVSIPAILCACQATGSAMAKPNYAHQKKQREQAAQRKRDEKLQRRQQKKDEAQPRPAETVTDSPQK